ncbi:MAG TPA: tRNA (adenosine(37)-N6)-dimethylallyltransferase MiaA [Methylibium sp.]|uniref:tRNA (adenosine(37)-N6)-dimethylallyltransferase MiaA n=1 Tax=Methylibium sp. TaxID=2067992 RepID=UPI002DBA439B|nr:tRNA (adenosine(37)-N6)-dimethylallyltransferase MiaA [Methylibium sp.]HEU4460266.1 tRNA (adenosine(37)-N6)-dimethylallyltransferase MiaA [Methylibium sp.]
MKPLEVIALAGPTAAGKTAAALALAEHLPLEVISVDSALVYRGMDIGTAKPSPAERAALPHHLIDLVDPAESYSAARFAADARRLVAAIRARGAWPLLVGGTMLYFKALWDGIDPLPPADAALRAAIDAEARERGWPALHAQLAQVDPLTAARLAPRDAQRIQRALEVHRMTGRPMSSLTTGRLTRDFQAERSAPAGIALISLEPADRGWLHRRIGERFAAMLDAGLIDEVRGLRARADLNASLASMRCVGYRQVWEALDAGADLERGSAAWHELLERGSAATRQLAKRQMTWLRSMPWRQVVACDAADAAEQVLRSVLPMTGSHR